ncbi:Transcription initiation factor TFIID subunit 6-like protein [Drosera capensis]
MSVVPKETIEVIAQSIGINNLSSDVSLALAPDIEYRIRETMQEAIKCMRHSKRTILTTEDVDSALNLRNIEPLYGFASKDPMRFKRAAGHKDLFYVDDKDLDFKEVIEAPLPRAPLDTSIVAHWLAIEGVQPAIPENPPIEVLSVQSDGIKLELNDDGLPVDIRFPVKHVLSRELQLYFDKIIQLTTQKSDTLLFRKALRSLATDSGLHPLVPYFTFFIADEVSRNLSNSDLLFAMMRIVWSLLHNPHIHIEPYLHQMMRSILTCMVAKRLGHRFSDNHWELRNFAANLVATICRRFAHVYSNLQPRVMRTLLHAFLDPTKALPQHYGAIQGLASLGPNVVRLLILPNLEVYMQLLEPEMQLEKQKNELKRQEAWHVYAALQFAAVQCMHGQMMQLPELPLLSPETLSKSSKKFTPGIPSKRKGSTDVTHLQPVKRLATGASVGPMQASSLHGDIQGMPGAFSSVIGSSDAGFQSMSQQMQDENNPGGSGRRDMSSRQVNKGSALAHAWKSDVHPGHLLACFFEVFGEGMIPFSCGPELSLLL